MTTERASCFVEAVAYARAMLDSSGDGNGAGWDDITFDRSVPDALDLLAEEYRDAIREERGMDLSLVKRMVQTLINAAKFPEGNRVRTHSQNMTVAARAIAERKTLGHLS